MGKNYIQPVRGTHDLIGRDMLAFRYIADAARNISEYYGYAEMATPIFEFSEVFHRSLGDTSDVVSKETYSFDDRGGEQITLRPEFTASIVRAFISNGLTQQLPFKAFYAGPAFRYERPQKGRQRQFHQIGVECLGANDPWYDAEAILCAHQLLHDILGEQADVTLEINTLGDDESRTKYRAMLVEYFSRYKSDLSEDSRLRLDKNPLRILDSKDASDRKLVADAPAFTSALNADSLAWYEAVTRCLEACNIAFMPSPRLVRGLDYYSHTVFEFTTEKLGAQATVLAGGRYNGLVKQMGGPDVPGIGWAAGIERLALLIADAHHIASVAHPVVIGCSGEEQTKQALMLAQQLRQDKVRTELIIQRNLSKLMKKANNANASFVILLDEPECDGQYMCKNMHTGAQELLSLSALTHHYQHYHADAAL